MNHILVVDQQFCIKPEKQEPALMALKQAIKECPWIPVSDPVIKDYAFPSLAESAEILKAQTLMDALELRNWIVMGITDGAITELGTRDYEKGDMYQQEHAFWCVLAPYIEPGYIECETFENYDHWRWVFDGTVCHYQEPIITWPNV